MAIRLMIKGPLETAELELSKRSIQHTKVEERGFCGHPYAHTQVPTAERDKVMGWFSETPIPPPINEPYPPGTLILYSYNQLGELI